MSLNGAHFFIFFFCLAYIELKKAYPPYILSLLLFFTFTFNIKTNHHHHHHFIIVLLSTPSQILFWVVACISLGVFLFPISIQFIHIYQWESLSLPFQFWIYDWSNFFLLLRSFFCQMITPKIIIIIIEHEHYTHRGHRAGKFFFFELPFKFYESTPEIQRRNGRKKNQTNLKCNDQNLLSYNQWMNECRYKVHAHFITKQKKNSSSTWFEWKNYIWMTCTHCIGNALEMEIEWKDRRNPDLNGAQKYIFIVKSKLLVRMCLFVGRHRPASIQRMSMTFLHHHHQIHPNSFIFIFCDNSQFVNTILTEWLCYWILCYVIGIFGHHILGSIMSSLMMMSRPHERRKF